MNAMMEFLQNVDLFQKMSKLELNAVAAFLELRRYKAGQVLFTKGESGTELFIMKSGKVASIATDSDGDSRRVYEFSPGRFFGEMSVIENEPRSATCQALEDSEVLVMDGLDFYRLVWDYPVIGVSMLSSMAKVMAGRLDEASGFLNDTVRWGETARRRAVIDDLSGLFNRRFLEETMRARFSRSHSSAPRCAMIMLDIDYFHKHNDAFGRAAGDAIISTAGAAFGRMVRDGDVAAHLAGDEFAFFMPEAGIDEAAKLAERIRQEAETLFLEFRQGPGGTPKRVTLSASLGVAASPDDAGQWDALMAAADKALFAAKESGRNRVERYRKT